MILALSSWPVTHDVSTVIRAVQQACSSSWYVQMRSHVNSRSFLWRKSLDNFLHRLLPRVWIPLYTTVSNLTIVRSRLVSSAETNMF